jgi:hypothetical protein
MLLGPGGLQAGPSGLFPALQCWQPDPSFYLAGGGAAEGPGQPVEKWAQVKQSLEAQLEDELELREGQIVKITHIIDRDWLRCGQCS